MEGDGSREPRGIAGCGLGSGVWLCLFELPGSPDDDPALGDMLTRLPLVPNTSPPRCTRLFAKVRGLDD